MDNSDGFLEGIKNKYTRLNKALTGNSFRYTGSSSSDGEESHVYQAHSQSCSNPFCCDCPTVYICTGDDFSQLVRAIEANNHKEPNNSQTSSPSEPPHGNSIHLSPPSNIGSGQNISHNGSAQSDDHVFMNCATIDEVDLAPSAQASYLKMFPQVSTPTKSISYKDETSNGLPDFPDAVHPRLNHSVPRPSVDEVFASTCIVCHQLPACCPVSSIASVLRRAHGRRLGRFSCRHCLFCTDRVEPLLEHLQEHQVEQSACSVCHLPLLAYNLDGRPWQLHVCACQFPSHKAG